MKGSDLPIRYYGHPDLRKKAKEVTAITSEIVKICEDMLAKMLSLDNFSCLSISFNCWCAPLMMDWGYGDSLQGARIGAKLVLTSFIVITILLGVWIW